MTDAFVYLAVRSASNRLRRQLRELRRPRYAAAMLLGAGYLAYVLFVQARPPERLPDPRLLELLAALALAAAFAWSWIFTPERRALALSPAEALFLLPAPLTRRQLVGYKLLRSQLVVLVNVALWTLLLGRGTGGVPPLLHAVGLWIVLSTWSLHRLGASFVRSTLAEHGWHGARRRTVALGALALAAALLVWVGVRSAPTLAAGWDEDAGAFLGALGRVASDPILAALLLPFRLVVRPLVVTSAPGWLTAVGPAAAVLAAHVVWVIRSDRAFEEAALEASLARARRRGARDRLAPASATPPIVALAPSGPPGRAIVWKNLIAATRGRRIGRWTAGIVAAGVLLALLSLRQSTAAEMIGALLLVWSGFAIAMGPLWLRNDLRSDLAHLDLLRSFPLRGRTIVAAEVLGATAVLTAGQAALLTLTWAALVGSPMPELDLRGRTTVLLAALLALPFVNLAAFTIQNGAALLFPAWVRVGMARTGGVEALGQHVLLLLAFLLVLGVVLAPPAGVASAVWAALGEEGRGAAAAALAAGAAALLAELRLAIGWLGTLFDRLDPGSVPAREE